MKIIIPMAGSGKRLGPLTYNKPKALVRLAHQRLIDHVLDTFRQVEEAYHVEYIFIVGYLGEQIREHMAAGHPEKKVRYYVQEQLLGQSHAVYLAREAISGPVLLTYCDTINEIDYSFLSFGTTSSLASVQEVDDPRRHGVAVVSPDGLVTKLVEKPETLENRLALTGVYYFSEGRDLMEAIETQMERGTTLGKEYYLADAINILIERGMHMRVERVSQWLDSGTPEALIATNASLLLSCGENYQNGEKMLPNVLIDPCFIDKSAHVENSIIGPNVSVGKHCAISGSILQNTIVDDGSRITDAILQDSLIGMDSLVSGKHTSTMVADHQHIGIDCTASVMTGDGQSSNSYQEC